MHLLENKHDWNAKRKFYCCAIHFEKQIKRWRQNADFQQITHNSLLLFVVS